MATLPYDMAVLALVLLGSITGYLCGRRIANARLRQHGSVFRQCFIAVVMFDAGSIFGCGYWHYIEPQYCVTAIEECERPGDPDPSWAEARLVRMGSRGFEAIFDGVRDDQVFHSGYGLLPYTLASMGPPAHRALLAAIDREQRPNPGLIYTLHRAFGDTSRLPRWIDDTILHNKNDAELGLYLLHIYSDVPSLSDGSNGVNPDFIVWYRTRFSTSEPTHGPF